MGKPVSGGDVCRRELQPPGFGVGEGVTTRVAVGSAVGEGVAVGCAAGLEEAELAPLVCGVAVGWVVKGEAVGRTIAGAFSPGDVTSIVGVALGALLAPFGRDMAGWGRA